MDVLQILLAVIVGCLIYYITKFLIWYYRDLGRIIRMISHIPGHERHWFWGSLLLGSDDKLEFDRESRRKMGPIYKLWCGSLNPEVCIASAKLARDILQTSFPKPKCLPGYGGLVPWIGSGLLLSEGAQHKRNRRLLTQAFHSNMLKTYLETVNRCADQTNETYHRHAKDGASFDVFHPAGLFSLDVVLECLISTSDMEEQVKDEIVHLTHILADTGFNRSLEPHLWLDVIFNLSQKGRTFNKALKRFHTITKSIIQKRRGELEDAPVTKTKDFLGVMISARDEDGLGLGDRAIEDEVATFLFAGHDTTSSVLSFTLYNLATNPRCQEACRKELNTILQDRDGDICYEDLQEMKYLAMCIKETLRFTEIIPEIQRLLTEDFKIGDHLLPKGLRVTIVLHMIQHDPSEWKDPYQYIPERFEQGNESQSARDFFSFVAFSAGPRNCIGQNFAMLSVKVALAKILTRYRVTYDATRPFTKNTAGVLSTTDGLWLKFEPLNH